MDTVTNKPTTILLIEDEAPIADAIEYAFRTEGFEIEWRQLGGEGIERIRDRHFELVILDIGLPDLNGFEVIKRIRTFSEIPVIFLTARSEEIDRVVGLEIGADDYVTKPFSPRELVARVKAILKRTRNSNYATASPSTVFAVDEPKAQISYCGERLELTRYEYLILKELLRQPERVYSRALLMERIWDLPGTSGERAIDTHVKSLRAKLVKVNGAQPIKTHRGLGYSIQNCHGEY